MGCSFIDFRMKICYHLNIKISRIKFVFGGVKMEYREVQRIAKKTMEYIKTEIRSGMLLSDVRDKCERKMLSLGADSYWYWNIGAFAFSGDETAVSVSGRNYKTSDRIINNDDIITIDLSPQNENIWGDYARTLIIENGNVVKENKNIKNSEWKAGLMTEDFLHEELFKYTAPDTTFEQLFFYMNEIIEKEGYFNLDFLGNLGHTIVKNKDNRIYIEKGNGRRLGDVGLFTFEPHISRKGSPFGYKKENIYYFDGDTLKEL